MRSPILAATLMLAATACVTHAQDSRVDRRDGGDDRRRWTDDRDANPDDRGIRRNGPPFFAATQEQWARAEAFYREHSPRRMELFDKYAAENNEQQTQQLRNRLYGRYRLLMRLQDNNQELFDFTLDQLKLEDSIRSRIAELNQQQKSPADDAGVRDLTTKWVNNVLSERQKRLEHFQTMLDEQRNKLKDDQQNIVAVVDKRLELWSNQPMQADDGPDGPGGPGGPGGKHPPGPVPDGMDGPPPDDAPGRPRRSQ